MRYNIAKKLKVSKKESVQIINGFKLKLDQEGESGLVFRALGTINM